MYNYSGVPMQQIPNWNQVGLQGLKDRLQQFDNNSSYQQQPNRSYFKTSPVTSVEEARAAMIDLDGGLNVFINIPNQEIYTKQFNLQSGGVEFYTYKVFTPMELPSNPNIEVQDIMKRLDQIQGELEMLKGANNATKPYANNANGTNNKK